MKEEKQSPPQKVTETKIGNTVFIVSAYYPKDGPTVSEKVRHLLDRETKRNHA